MHIYEGSQYRFTLLSEHLIRLEHSYEGEFTDSKTQVVVNRDFSELEHEIPHKVIEDENELNIYTKYLHLNYKKNQPFSNESLFIDFFFKFQPYGNMWYFGDEIETLKGTTRTLDWIDGPTDLEEGIISYYGFSLLDDSKSHLLNENDEIEEKQYESIDQYIFAFGHDYTKALKYYYHLTGYPPVLPRYALGNWWSRFWEYSETEYKELVTKFESKNIPLSVAVIDMDWHLTEIPEGFGSSWTGFTWDKNLFPDPARFINWLREKGLAVTLNLHPADGIRAFEDDYPKVAKRLGLKVEANEPAVFDFTSAEFRDAYFEDVLHPNEDIGVDFWWVDWQQGSQSAQSGLDPLWLLNHYHFKDLLQRDKEPLILSRYAGPGSHRYPVGFSGDTITTWESLEFQPYMTSTASNIGYSWWSHDIGGHMRGYKDEELSVRWVQYGVFSPINRLHSSNSLFAGKEPWRYSLEKEQIMAEFLRIRHQLIPYIYTMNVNNSVEGIPLIRPLYYEEPDAIESYDIKNEYYFGSELLVLPITKSIDEQTNLASQKIYLPDGDWYDIWSNYRYQGNSLLNVTRGLEHIPVFAKSGAIIPLDPNPNDTKVDELPKRLDWKIYPGKSNEFRLIEHLNNKECVTIVKYDDINKELSINLEGDTDIIPNNRVNTLVFSATENFIIEDADTSYDDKRNELAVAINDSGNNVVLNVTGFEKIKKQTITQSVFNILDKAEIDYILKEELMSLFENNDDLIQITSKINDIKNISLRDSLFELIYISNS